VALNRPVTVPSFFAVIVMSWIWSRPWWAHIMFSERVSIHFTGLPSRLASTIARASSPTSKAEGMIETSPRASQIPIVRNGGR